MGDGLTPANAHKADHKQRDPPRCWEGSSRFRRWQDHQCRKESNGTSLPSIPGPSTPAGDLAAYLRRFAAETLHMRLTQHIQHFYLPLPQAAPAHRPHALAHATSPRYSGIVETHIRLRWGTTPLVKISHEDVAEWISNIRLAPASVAYIHRVSV
jgi:hypothetical protein